eukprot:Platyproteum_vivax@DN1684_c0_g1_i1.p1
MYNSTGHYPVSAFLNNPNSVSLSNGYYSGPLTLQSTHVAAQDSNTVTPILTSMPVHSYNGISPGSPYYSGSSGGLNSNFEVKLVDGYIRPSNYIPAEHPSYSSDQKVPPMTVVRREKTILRDDMSLPSPLLLPPSAAQYQTIAYSETPDYAQPIAYLSSGSTPKFRVTTLCTEPSLDNEFTYAQPLSYYSPIQYTAGPVEYFSAAPTYKVAAPAYNVTRSPELTAVTRSPELRAAIDRISTADPQCRWKDELAVQAFFDSLLKWSALMNHIETHLPHEGFAKALITLIQKLMVTYPYLSEYAMHLNSCPPSEIMFIGSQPVFCEICNNSNHPDMDAVLRKANLVAQEVSFNLDRLLKDW